MEQLLLFLLLICSAEHVATYAY